MSDREHIGSFSRKHIEYHVYVTYSIVTESQYEISFVHIVNLMNEISIRPSEYDESNKLHVNAFIVVTDVLAQQDNLVIDSLIFDNMPSDTRLITT